MSKIGLKNIRTMLAKSDMDLNVKKILSFLFVLNLAELRILACLLADGKASGIDRKDIATLCDMNESVVAQCLDDLTNSYLISRRQKKKRKQGRPKASDSEKREVDYVLPKYLYRIEINLLPFPEGMEMMRRL